MIHLVTGYAGYEHIQSEDEGAYNASFFGDGQYVMQEGSQFEGSILDNNTVRILDGNLLMYGRHIRIARGTYEDLIIQTGTAGKNRIDLICMTYAKNDSNGTEQAYLQVIKGVETAGTAVVPVYTDGNILEGAILNNMPLYKVVIEGIYLKELVPMFTVIPTYKTLAQQYAAQFEATIKALKDADILDTMEEIEANTQANMFAGALSLKEHITDKNNPHGVTKSQVGLGNVPNVATNDQTPTFSTASTLVNITSGEKLSVSFGKIAKAIADLISHIGSKANPHAVTKSQVGLGNVDNTADSAKSVKYAATATSAGSLTTARNFRTNLGKTSTASFNGTADCDPGVIGTLGLGNGGTGATTAAGARTNLGLGSAATQSHTSNLPSSGSAALITSGAVYSAFATVRDEFFTTKVLSPTIASLSNVSSKTIYAWRSGNVITVALSCGLSATISDWTTLASGLPKPKYQLFETVCGHEASFVRNLRVTINLHGELKICDGAAKGYNTVITYVCA